ncbi:Replication protein A 70 kDa DNA-binding subunit B, partial [Linum perenne]
GFFFLQKALSTLLLPHCATTLHSFSSLLFFSQVKHKIQAISDFSLSPSAVQNTMSKSVSPDAISTLLSIPKPDSPSDLPEIVVQVTNLQPKGKAYGFDANDGKMKLKSLFNSRMSPDIISGKVQNLGLIRIMDYTINEIPNKAEKYMIVTSCEVVSPALEAEINNGSQDEGILLKKPKLEDELKSQVKSEATGIVMKAKNETVTKSAAQIVNEQRGNMAPSARMAMTRRVHPLVSLNPYQGNWTIKVRVTSKGNMRTYKNMRGEGCVFNVELTDEDGTQIQATMFNEAAKKFFERFQLGKVYYISKGSLRVANKQYKTVENDYEMTLNENSEVEEVANESAMIPATKFNFVPIDNLGPYVNSKDLVDVIGVVQSVSPTLSIRRKSDNEQIPKRDVTIVDESKKTVVVSLWNELATGAGQELLDIAEQSPVVAIKALRVGDFQGVSLSTVGKSMLQVNPDTPESKKLRSWYDSDGKDSSVAPVGSGLSPSMKNGGRSMYADRVPLSRIVNDQSLGDDKPAFFNIRGYVSFIKPDQTMWYRACKTCNKKVTDGMGGGYWCEGCQKNDSECSLRYILALKVTDASGEGWVSAFNDEAEKILGSSADELNQLRSQQDDTSSYNSKLKAATWNPHLFRVSVTQNEYNHEKRQRITVKAVSSIDFAAESKFLLEEISKMRVSQ